MNQINQMGCIALTILGIILLISPDLILSKNTSNAYLKNIYNNNKIFASCLLVAAFYLYTIEYNQTQVPQMSQMSQVSGPLTQVSGPLTNPLSQVSSQISSFPLSSELSSSNL